MAPTIAACQLAVDDLAVESNLAAIHERVAGLPERVDIAVFPEYALTGFVPDQSVADVALGRDGTVLERLRNLARAEGTALVVGFLEASGEARYNAVTYIDSTGEMTVYRKRHLWDREREMLDAGAERVIVDTPAGRAGLLTCYDLNFVAESAAFTEKRVDLLCVVGAWPATYSENWRLLVRARALDGVRWAVAAGRTGSSTSGDTETTYAGRSLVARPDGGVCGELDRREDDLIVDLDPAVLERQRDLIGLFDDSE